MNVSDPTSAANALDPRRSPRDRFLIGLAVGFLVVGLGFVLVDYAARMWRSGHYQFFPFVFAFVAAMLWNRRDEILAASRPASAKVTAAVALVLIVIAALANLLYSNFGGILVTVAAVWLAVYAVVGLSGLRAAAPVLAILVFALPLPMNLDQTLIVRMQGFASSLASRMLDGLGFIHFRQGVVLQTETAQYLTEEACSGIRALFSSLAVVAAHGVAFRHRWWRLSFNLCQTVFWVFLGNSLRVAAVVALADRFPMIADGAGHELLGLAVFAFILGMVASTDALVSTLIRRELFVEVTWKPPDLAPPVNTSPAYPPLSRRWAAVILASLGVLAVIGLRAEAVRKSYAGKRPDVGAMSEFAQGEAQESDLPASLAGFDRVSFEQITRGRNYLWAMNSDVWHFRRDGLTALISIDSPWDEWHNLYYCYSNVGWQVDPRFAVPLEVDQPGALTGEYPHSDLRMRRTDRYGLVLFSAIDRSGRHVPEVDHRAVPRVLADPRLLGRRIRAALGFGSEVIEHPFAMGLPISTVQMVVESPVPWNDNEVRDLRRLFAAAREHLVRRRRQ